MHWRKLDYNKHCQCEFGQYVQAHNDDPKTKNTPAPRTLDCIYMRYTSTKQGGHELLDLSTRELISRHAITKVPVTPAVIKAMEDLVEANGRRFL